MLNVRLSQDLLAALIFILIGSSALWFGRMLEPGTSAEMGPGYLPRALGWLILGFGIITMLRSVWIASPRVGGIKLRPILVVMGAVGLFALLVEPAGFIPASVAVVLLSTFGMGRPSLPYLLGQSILLPAALAVVFVLGLGLPFDLWWF
ncbi:MAG TPA: tripartite tricarboxylate transporter TctB family protein [Paracoccus sp. (in: a-proteobacteria)]|uniref:tripartite tricarboxylate transporter TctB family protein n=1 Tax=Paracoccus sp. TaxID=267 RepID=UPI002BC34182|nr:tripartite tricarboxylate transporter TctB family protein [Paracoccus sp. (in: a-proteobacteria)]HWL55589.1 tripartite tricarboxylate transporter TctB family protein [Paracoccus sp. (in: a-proteobacteria)]